MADDNAMMWILGMLDPPKLPARTGPGSRQPKPGPAKPAVGLTTQLL